MNLKQMIRSGLALMLFSVHASLPASAEPLFFGPSPYLSQSDIPTGFYAGGSPSALENFEDRKLDSPFTASAGGMLAPGGLTDSVDADDGTLDGSGSSGVSWYYGSGSTGVTFTFSGLLPTSAGLVWTDGSGTTTFEAFGPGMVSLGKTGPVLIADGSFTGTTADDRFFGVQDLDGIFAIKLTNTSGGIEIDHVQYGSAQSSAIPEPSVFSMLMIGILGLYFHNRLKNVRAQYLGTFLKTLSCQSYSVIDPPGIQECGAGAPRMKPKASHLVSVVVDTIPSDGLKV